MLPEQRRPRTHLADDIFGALAGQLFAGEWPPGTALPSESTLAARFSTSRITLRQAVHRLAELRLVQVRQGGSTLALDPDQTSDLRVFELDLLLGPRSARNVVDVTERQLMHGHAILRLAERRATPLQLAVLADIVEEHAATGGDNDQVPAFEERFWSACASATGNHLYRRETAWWFNLLRVAAHVRHPVLGTPVERVTAMRELVRRLTTKQDAAALYLSVVDMILDRLHVHLATLDIMK